MNYDNPTDEEDDINFREGFETLNSPFRPFPLGAKKALNKHCSRVIFDDEDPRIAYVLGVPDEDVLAEWEIEHIKNDSPEEIWETDYDERVEIYEDRVEQDGREITISTEEAKEKARELDYFTRIDDDADV